MEMKPVKQGAVKSTMAVDGTQGGEHCPEPTSN